MNTNATTTADDPRAAFDRERQQRVLRIVRLAAELRRELIDDRAATAAASEAGVIPAGAGSTAELHSKLPSAARWFPYGDGLRRGFDGFLSRMVQLFPDIARELSAIREENRE